MSTAQKQTRLNIRVGHHQKEVITQAAQLGNTTISEFVTRHAFEAASRALAETTHFVLPDEQWQAFCEALDAPPKDIPTLRKLLSEPGVFDA